MALIEFKNLPDTSTPITAENLNNNFTELNTKITNISDGNRINENLRVSDATYYNLSLDTIAQNSIYSTDELPIGAWIDGKTLYRKVYTLNFTAGYVTKSVETANLGAETYTTVKAVSSSDPITEQYYIAETDRLIVVMNGSTKTAYVTLGSSYPTRPCTVYLILEYTKAS